MPGRKPVSLSVALVLSCAFARASTEEAVIIRAQTIYTVTQGVIEDGEILIQGGKIQAVGKSVQAPSDSEIHTAEAVIPGLIDAHTHLALDRSSRPPGPIAAEWKAVDHVDLDSPMLRLGLAGGVTSIVTRPGSGIISAGQSVALKLKGKSGPATVLKPYVDLKMAIRPLIKLRDGQTPATVMGWHATAHEMFWRAQEIIESGEPVHDERLKAFVTALRGDVMVHIHAHYPSEIMMAVNLAREFGFEDRLTLAHAHEGYPIAEVLAESKVIPIVGPVYINRMYGDSRSHNTVKELMDAGVTVAIQTDQSREHIKDFRELGTMLARHGLSEKQALETMTINGAKAMMLDDRIGSIEVGKDADLVLLDGNLFDLATDPIDKVFVDGVVEYERENRLHPDGTTNVGPFKRLRGKLTDEDFAFALVNAQIFTVSHGTIPNGTVIVESGKFTQVVENGRVPKGMPKLDVGGRAVVPGFISARAFPNDWTGDLKWQIQNDEVVEPVTPEMNARFAIDPWFPSFPVIRGLGLTTQNITPGTTNLMGGAGVVIKTAGMDVEKMIRMEPSSMVFSLTRESTRYWSRDSQIPVTLESASRMIRDTLDDARKYQKAGTQRPYEPRLRALLPVLRREVPVIIHAKSIDEIREAIKIASDYGLRLIVSGAVEAHHLADELARAEVGVILGDSASGLESIRGGGDGYRINSPAILSQKGVKVAFFGPSGSRRGMPTGRLGGEPALNAAWAFRNGASEQDALRMATLNAAEMLGIEDRVGSIDVGKDADFMILEGHPFDYRVLPLMVFIDGVLIHEGPI
jgi:imidazolonepropionase-like amidohydrolase